MIKELENEFNNELNESVEESIRLNLGSSRFQQMLNQTTGLKLAKNLLRKNDPNNGLANLLLADKVELSLEYLVLKPKYEPLFNEEELKVAKRRLGRKD